LKQSVKIHHRGKLGKRGQDINEGARSQESGASYNHFGADNEHSWLNFGKVLANVILMKSIPTQKFQKLIVWQKSHGLVLEIYRLTDQFPKNELYGLTAQIRRAAVSVPANIAEGYKRRTKPDKVRLFNIAQASLEECRYYLILAEDLGYGKTALLLALSEEISKMLAAYIGSLLTPGS
jgi:four helix bundle protein